MLLKSENIYERDILRKAQTLNLTQEEFKTLTRPMSRKDIELIVKHFPHKKAKVQIFLLNSMKYLKEK